MTKKEKENFTFKKVVTFDRQSPDPISKKGELGNVDLNQLKRMFQNYIRKAAFRATSKFTRKR